MRTLVFLLFCLQLSVCSAQFLSDAQLDTAYVYSSVEEAMRNPEEVYVLRLKVKHGEIPPQIFDLPYLHILEMKRGKIASLPEDFKRLEYLISVDLTRNDIESFPSVLLEMPQLEVLRLGKNPINRVPEEVARMTGLQVLDLWSTQVQQLPVIIGEMQSLREVDLRMIEISQAEQDYLSELMPEVQFHFSVPCNCR